MKTVAISQARENIYRIVKETIMETLYLTNIPVMKDSIVQGMNTPVENCLEVVDNIENLSDANGNVYEGIVKIIRMGHIMNSQLFAMSLS